MKKYINTSFIYAAFAMAGGVFYREFTKFNGFTGRTALGTVHTHLFFLGMTVFLLVALFSENTELAQDKLFCIFYRIYNIGVPLTAVMMTVRGITQVMELELSKGADAAISGVAGIGHILTGVGIVLLLIALKRTAK